MAKETKNKPITQTYLEERFSALEQKQDEALDAVIHNFEKVYSKLDEHTKRFDNLGHKIDETQSLLMAYHNRMDLEFEILKSRIGKIEEVLKEKLGVKFD